MTNESKNKINDKNTSKIYSEIKSYSENTDLTGSPKEKNVALQNKKL